jgi:hypothetical protein
VQHARTQGVGGVAEPQGTSHQKQAPQRKEHARASSNSYYML